MMKRTLIPLLILMAALVGCTKSADESIPSIESIVWKYDNSYNAVSITKDTSNLIAPKGILFYEGKIYVCDKEQNAVVVLSEEGKYEGKIGSLGSAPLEFIEPTAIAADHSNIYIVDSGNNRIQVLTLNWTYVDSIALPQYTQVKFCSIAVDDSGYVYVSNDAVIGNESVLLCGNIHDGMKEIMTPFAGSLCSGNTAYALEALEFEETKESYAMQSGRNRLYRLNGFEAPTMIADLPLKYTPAGIVLTSTGFVCMSSATCSLDEYSMDGAYEQTIYEDGELLQNHPFDMYLASDGQGNYYINNIKHGGLVALRKSGINE